MSLPRWIAPVAGALVLLLALAAPSAAADAYGALGDSYSAGYGTGSRDLDVACGRSRYAYPYLIARERPRTALTFVACGGAVTADVIARQVPYLTSATRLVTITVGGNDIGFSRLIAACTVVGCAPQLRRSHRLVAGRLASRLDATYAAIGARAPSATVLVLGYPRPFALRTCLAAFGVRLDEQRRLDALTDELDAVIRSRAQLAGFTYVDPNRAWTGHDVCAPDPFTNGLVPLAASDSYHPTRAGHSAGYAPLIRAIVG